MEDKECECNCSLDECEYCENNQCVGCDYCDCDCSDGCICDCTKEHCEACESGNCIDCDICGCYCSNKNKEYGEN